MPFARDRGNGCLAHDYRTREAGVRAPAPAAAGYIFRAIHHAAALVIEAQNGRHHVRAAFRRFQRRRTFFLIPDTTGLAALTSGEGSSQHTGVTLSCLLTSGSQCRVPFLGKEAIPIAFGHNA